MADGLPRSEVESMAGKQRRHFRATPKGAKALDSIRPQWAEWVGEPGRKDHRR